MELRYYSGNMVKSERLNRNMIRSSKMLEHLFSSQQKLLEWIYEDHKGLILF